ncbi:MAG: hypothetical protein US70_C0007G0014 [Parcubacteria group bacterium GW2011_GWD2_38_11]|nr:MAG: hypothetical protein US70_C0007G0014 [Parcubacteria group bacterium GW2011_GWD2_38_11]
MYEVYSLTLILTNGQKRSIIRGYGSCLIKKEGGVQYGSVNGNIAMPHSYNYGDGILLFTSRYNAASFQKCYEDLSRPCIS